VFPAPYGRVSEYFDTLAQANRRALELDERLELGLPPTDVAGDPPLKDAAGALMTRKRVTGTRRKLTRGGEAHWERLLEPWLEGPFADTPLSLLRRAPLEDHLLTVATRTPDKARKIRQGLLATLNYAADRGHTFDLAIMRIPPIIVEARERVALTPFELDYLVPRVPAIGRRLVLFQATVGNRIDELFGAEPAHLELDADTPTMFVPRTNCKERRDKRIPLTPEEVALAREQLGGLHAVTSSPTSGCPTTMPGAPRVFMTAGVQVYPTGTVRRTKQGPVPWRHTQYDRLVWQPGVSAAADDWRADNGLGPTDPTPFEWYVDPLEAPPDGRRRNDDGRRTITTHDLRATAVTFMRDLGIDRDVAAARIGHHDRGELIDAVYDQGDRTRRVGRALADAAPLGLRAALGAAS